MADGLKKYDSLVAAKYLMALAYQKGIILNVTKVQKLLYIAYGYFLTKYDHVLITESPKAWPYGPVFPRTRNKINFGKIITLDETELSEISGDQKVTDAFNYIIDTYADYTASQLTAWSHMEGSPWSATTKQPNFDWNSPIPNTSISEYFSQLSI